MEQNLSEFNPSLVGDNSGSGNTPVNSSNLINMINSSQEESRDSSWWNNLWDSIKNIFSGNGWFKSKSVPNYGITSIEARDRANAYSSLLTPTAPTSTFKTSLNPVQRELISEGEDKKEDFNLKDSEDLMNLFWNIWSTYNNETDKRAQEVNSKLDDYFKNYYKYQIQGLKEAGINPLLAFQSISSPSIPSFDSGRVSTYNPGSILGSYAQILGQNKQLGSNFLKILVSLLGLFV